MRCQSSIKDWDNIPHRSWNLTGVRVGSDRIAAMVGGVSGKFVVKSGSTMVGRVVSVRHLA